MEQAPMCGRFGLDAPTSKIKAQFHLDALDEIEPRYNIPPSSDVLCVSHISGEEINHAFWARWGLIPFWANDKKIGNSLANARAETVAQKPAFRESFKKRRCVMVMSGFFEWQRVVSLQPYYFKLKDNQLLAVAALWDNWVGKEGETIASCALITTNANRLMEPIHNRMPVLLDEKGVSVWLDNSVHDNSLLQALLKPYAGDDLMCYPVTTKMNNTRFIGREAIKPLKE